MSNPSSPTASENVDDDFMAIVMRELQSESPSPPPGQHDDNPSDDQPKSEEQPASKRPKIEERLSRGGSCPPHPGFIGGLCIRCGHQKPIGIDANSTEDPAAQQDTLPLKYIHHGLEVSKAESDRLRETTIRNAMNSRRLLLILDLDHTLLNSTRSKDLTEQQTNTLLSRLKQEPTDGTAMLFHLTHVHMWTKLRPGVREFLAEAHKLFDLHIFTMGDKMYAAAMAHLLDPSGKLFGGRVASSSDAGIEMVKDIQVLMGAEELVLILDDTVEVWPKNHRNVFQVPRYTFFPLCAENFGQV